MRVAGLSHHGVHLPRQRPGGGDPRPPHETAAAQLARAGDQPIQVSTPALNGPAAFYRIANYVRTVSQGQPIGLMGFSAGGALAMRLAGQPGLNVTAVMNYYGPPDLNAWIASHHNDFYYRYVASHVHLTSAVEKLLSGPSTSNAYFVGRVRAQGPRGSIATVSTASFHAGLPARPGLFITPDRTA